STMSEGGRSQPQLVCDPTTAPELSRGSTGQQVRHLQSIMSKLGYNAGTDVTFGELTEDIVKTFQANTGYDSTGIVDHSTWNHICDQLKSQSHPQLVCDPAAASYPELSVRSLPSQQVRNLQNILIKLNLNIGSSTATGNFGQGTEAAVKNFQQMASGAYPNIIANGVADSNTWKALCSVLAKKEASPPPKLTYYLVTFTQVEINKPHS